MPFDAASFAPDTISPDLARPSLEALSYALRHPETWPKGFRWDYGSCSSCAMGLTKKLWENPAREERCDLPDLRAEKYGKLFGMPQAASDKIFLYLTEGHGCGTGYITPHHVADAIDAYLARG
jgi:hypothetical protein